MSCVIVDTSLAVKWAIEESHSREARLLRDEWKTQQIVPIVPSWFACEIANVLFQRMRDKTITLAGAQQAIQTILGAVVVRDSDPAVALRALELAVQFRLQASYDAQYLALAEHLGCDLWTAADRFRNRVKGTFSWVRSLGEVVAS